MLFSIMQSEPRSRKSCTSFSCLGSVGVGARVSVTTLDYFAEASEPDPNPKPDPKP